MDDNARPHRTLAVEELLENEDITRMDWPAYFQDLNPIEHVWDVLGRQGEHSGSGQRPPTSLPLPPTSREDLRLDGYLEYPYATQALHLQTSMSSPGFSLAFPTGLAPPHSLHRSPQGSQLESMFTIPSIQSESSLQALSRRRWAYGSRSEPPSHIIDVNGAWES
ncbi:transposable element Tc3 transposase [Trichonephila clavipes]|nr:transposable element Tc3 transposase [Trichonephila clavipes]